MESNKPTGYVEALKILSAAEVRVLDLVEKGYTNSEIAEELGNSPRTVQTHRNNICLKLGVKGRLGLIKWLWEVRNGKNRE
jgi:DNA-binding CsgD family transcriptional regulator